MITVVSSIKGILGILGFWFIFKYTANLPLAQSTVLAMMVVGSLLSAFVFAGGKLTANKFLLAAAGLGFGLLVVVLEVPFFQNLFGMLQLIRQQCLVKACQKRM